MSQARRVEGDNLFSKTIHARADQFYRGGLILVAVGLKRSLVS